MRKYLIYAIGEILLVVIGILIALQVNTWNENRHSQKEEIRLVMDLRDELSANSIYLANVLVFEERRHDSAMKLIKLTGPKAKSVPIDTIASILAGFNAPPYSPLNSKLLQILETDQNKLIRNDSLKQKLREYKYRLDLNQSNFNNGGDVVSSKLREHISWLKLNQIRLRQIQHLTVVFKEFVDADFNRNIYSSNTEELLRSKELQANLADYVERIGWRHFTVQVTIDFIDKLLNFINREYGI